MKKLNENETQYDSLIEFALFGKDDEVINTKTLIARKKSSSKIKKNT